MQTCLSVLIFSTIGFTHQHYLQGPHSTAPSMTRNFKVHATLMFHVCQKTVKFFRYGDDTLRQETSPDPTDKNRHFYLIKCNKIYSF